MRGREAPEEFLRALGRRLARSAAPVSTHLVADEHLAILWAARRAHRAGRCTTRAPAGATTPRLGSAPRAAGGRLRRERARARCIAPGAACRWSTLRHRPRVGRAATDTALRREIRAELGIGEGTFLVGAIGALKRAEGPSARGRGAGARSRARRDAALVILGGVARARRPSPELDRVLDARGAPRRGRAPAPARLRARHRAVARGMRRARQREPLRGAVDRACRRRSRRACRWSRRDVGGQGEIAHPGLELAGRRCAPPREFAARLARMPVRAALAARGRSRARRARGRSRSRARAGRRRALDTLFVTANLNAGGAQRSLVNLAPALARAAPPRGRRLRRDAPRGVSRDAARARRVEVFRRGAPPPTTSRSPSRCSRTRTRAARANLCFWNVAPGVKLARPPVRAARACACIDVSPGATRSRSWRRRARFARAIAYSARGVLRAPRRAGAQVSRSRAAPALRARRA